MQENYLSSKRENIKDTTC